jgi:transcriptional regulator with XRE-family HTH domain
MQLKAYLKKEKISAEEFARRLGVRGWTVHRYINAHGRVPEPPIMARIIALTDGRVRPNDFYPQVNGKGPHRG